MPIVPFPNNSSADFEAHLAELAALGLTVVADVLGPDQLRELPTVVDRALAARQLHPGQKPEHVVNYNMCANLISYAPIFAELCLHPAVYSIVQRLLGTAVVLSTIAALEPKPGATDANGGEIQGLHRDGLGGGLPVAGLQGCQSLWLLDDMDPQNGATRFGVGTHKLDVPQDMDIEKWVKEEGRLVQFSLHAGCAVLYDAPTLHAMSTNHAGRRRRALACFFTQAGLPRMCDQRYYLSRKIQAQVSPQARVMLGLDSPEPLSACGKFYQPGAALPQCSVGA